MNVVRLVSRHRGGQTTQVLRALLELAERGELVGLAVCYRGHNGFEDSAITGIYRDNPDAGATSTLRLSMRLANSRGEYDLSP